MAILGSQVRVNLPALTRKDLAQCYSLLCLVLYSRGLVCPRGVVDEEASRHREVVYLGPPFRPAKTGHVGKAQRCSRGLFGWRRQVAVGELAEPFQGWLTLGKPFSRETPIPGHFRGESQVRSLFTEFRDFVEPAAIQAVPRKRRSDFVKLDNRELAFLHR